MSIDFFLPLFGMTLFINLTDSQISQSDIQQPDQAGAADANDHAWDDDDDDMITEKPKKTTTNEKKTRLDFIGRRTVKGIQ